MPRLLLIDDDHGFAVAARRNLQARQSDWTVDIATPETDARPGVKFWEAALELIRATKDGDNPVDLVLTDLCMPDHEAGYAVLQRVKETDPGIMTILYTGRPDLLDRARAYGLNVFAITNRTDPQVRIDDELWVLATAALNIRKQQRQLGALERFADPDVARAMAAGSKAVRLARHELAVVFWDIRGFSLLTQQLSGHPDRLAEFIAEYAELARRVIRDHNGILDKFIGDGVMALFGHPLKGEADPAVAAAYRAANRGAEDLDRKAIAAAAAGAAVDAALAFQDAFHPLAEVWHHKFEDVTTEKIERPRLGCGINLAPVLAGYIGTDRGEFTALGHGVNLAARVQDKAHDRTILTTRPAVRRIGEVPGWKEKYVFDELPEAVEFKNIPGKHVLFAVRRPRRE